MSPKNSEAKIKANNKWNKNNYEQINLAVPKGSKEYYKSEALKQGYKSLNQFIKDAIQEKIKKELL